MTQQAIGGYNSRLPDDVLQDTGVLYLGSSAVFMASRGGLTFDPGSEIRNTPYDGQKARVKGLDRNVGWEPTIKGKVIQFYETDFPNIQAMEGHTGSSGHRTYTPRPSGVMYQAGDYLDNLRLVYARTGGGFVEITFADAIVRKWQLAGTDKQEGEVDIEIEAVRDPSGTDEGDAPFVIRTISAITS